MEDNLEEICASKFFLLLEKLYYRNKKSEGKSHSHDVLVFLSQKINILLLLYMV